MNLHLFGFIKFDIFSHIFYYFYRQIQNSIYGISFIIFYSCILLAMYIQRNLLHSKSRKAFTLLSSHVYNFMFLNIEVPILSVILFLIRYKLRIFLSKNSRSILLFNISLMYPKFSVLFTTYTIPLEKQIGENNIEFKLIFTYFLQRTHHIVSELFTCCLITRLWLSLS